MPTGWLNKILKNQSIWPGWLPKSDGTQILFAAFQMSIPRFRVSVIAETRTRKKALISD
jgi:hypothetical protein